MATAPPEPKPVPPPLLKPPAAVEQEPAWPQEPPDVSADRTVLLFWVIAFTILAFVTFCDLVVSLFR